MKDQSMEGETAAAERPVDRDGAMRLTHAHDWVGAAEAWERLALDKPGFESLYRLTEALFHQRRLRDTVEWGLRATQAKPDDVRAPLLVARAQSGLGEHREAAATWARVLSLDEGSFEAWARLAECHLELSDLDAAVKAFARAVPLQPGHAFGQKLAPRLLDATASADRTGFLQAVLGGLGWDDQIVWLRDLAVLRPGAIEVAEELTSRIIARAQDPAYLDSLELAKRLEALREGGRAALESRRAEDAAELWARVSAEAPEDDEALRGSIAAGVALGRLAAVSGPLRALLAHRPDDTEVLKLSVAAHIAGCRLRDAAEIAAKLIQIDPQSALDLLGSLEGPESALVAALALAAADPACDGAIHGFRRRLVVREMVQALERELEKDFVGALIAYTAAALAGEDEDARRGAMRVRRALGGEQPGLEQLGEDVRAVLELD